MMQVWLIDDQSGKSSSSLEKTLRELEGRPETGLRLLGNSSSQSDLVTALRKKALDQLDVLVIHEPAWPEGWTNPDLLGLGIVLVVATTSERAQRFRSLANQYPILFVPPNCAADELWLTLMSAKSWRRRENHWQSQIARLQQRLSDRILIERAKGILVQRLQISEDEAYKRLRVLSRRQRRQIRDIAQSLIDTQYLFAPGNNGFGDVWAEQPEREPQEPAP
jgi:hypothetical protein